MSALVVVTDDSSTDWYANTSWWTGFLELHLEPVVGQVRAVLEKYVSVVGVDFTQMDDGDPAIVGSWLHGAIGAEIESEMSPESRRHLSDLRERLAALVLQQSRGQPE